MDNRLKEILEKLLLTSEVLNKNLRLLAASEILTPEPEHFQIIEQIRSNCLCTLQNLRSVERGMRQTRPF